MSKIRLPEEILPDLPGIVVLSHGPLAASVVESVCFVIGDLPNSASLCFEVEDNPEQYQDLIVETVQKFPAGCLVFVDIFGGTPCNQLMRAIMAKRIDVLAMAGVNMTMLMDANDMREMYSGEELRAELRSAVVDGIVDINAKLA